MQRVIVYVDGFNLYFGLRSKGWKRFYWLDIRKLAQSLLKQGQKLIRTKYFTSRVTKPPDKAARQNTFMEALQTLPDVDIFFGHYLINTIECKRCGNILPRPNEKMTDVNIAVELLTDAFQDIFDTAILISADSDLVGPIRKVKLLTPDKRIIIAFPPDRHSFALEQVADASFTIGRKKFAESLFPDSLQKADGYTLTRPAQWK